MVYYNYSVAFNAFVSDLKDKLVANGWTQEEGGYNTCKPSGYASIYVEPLVTYATARMATDGTATTYNWTLIRVRMRSTYDGSNHRPLTSANGGNATYRIVRDADWSTSATGLILVKGWIWNKGFILYLSPDPNTVTSGTKIDQIIICAEGQAVDASANTILLLAPTQGEDETEYGMKSVDATNQDNCAETHFIDVLGDGHCYIPIILGFGVSSISNKIRTMPLYAWRYRGDGIEQRPVICYQIPEIRPTLFMDNPQIEQIGDTFTVDAQTFKYLVWFQNYREWQGRPMISKTHAQHALAGYWTTGASLNWYAWVRSV